jgi:tetratricopeptide (TPR) repeat protein
LSGQLEVFIEIGIIRIILLFVFPLYGYLFTRRRRFRRLYEVIWKKSSSLKAKDLLGNRPFHEYYYQRKEDDKIRTALNEKKNLLIIGSPLAGKTRAVFQALNTLNNPYDVIIPRCADINLDVFQIPKHSTKSPKAVFFDDLNRFVENQNFEFMLRAFIDANIIIIATCRSRIEYDKVKSKIAEKNLSLETIFSENIITLERISDEVGKAIANKVNKPWEKVKFNGSIGSIFMPLNEMEKRYNECQEIEKTILRTIKRLYISGIFEEKQVFPLKWIKIVAQNHELKMEQYLWTEWLEKLKNKEFINILHKDKIWAEKIYLEDVVKLEAEIPRSEILVELTDLFSKEKEPKALFMLGNRAYSAGFFILEKATFMKIAIKAYAETLKIKTLKRHPMDFAMTKNNLGNAYSKLAEVEAKADNCNKAIKVYTEALKVRTLRRHPIDYAMTQNNLGNAYSKLVDVEAKVDNCNKAIKAYAEALKVRTLDRFPMDYAMTQNNLGNTFCKLAEVEAKVDNCNKAIKAYSEALKVITFDRYPMDCASTQSNLGNAYSMMAEIEAKVDNCNKAIKAFAKALKVRTLERYPMDYAWTQINLGTTYWTLAEVEAKADNCKKAINAYKEALKVFTKEDFPEIYPNIEQSLKDLLVFCENE